MKTPPKTNFLKDYKPFPFTVSTIDLDFSLHEDHALISSTLEVQRKDGLAADLLLNGGPDLHLLTVTIDDRELSDEDYHLNQNDLLIIAPPARFTLNIKTRIEPQNNTSLEGLYRSNGIFCTQCEAEGFRKISYFPDRPDVMTVYSTTVEADKKKYPVLLANGNLTASGDRSGNRHYASWHDPFMKPCYLFALVAGDLFVLKDKFTTKSGREVSLQIYVEHHNADKCSHAMHALNKAMAWDERRFNLEYDLDQYMIVAVDDFNAGAMENKGLNVFNSKYILAKPETATDSDYEGIESVVAHEYFHNWTGNRVTCRDWFQLSLKEGLTVFRDQEFTSDTSSRAIKRINDVSMLRSHQFLEDASPMAHPVRPESYIEINNFYTLTVYEKGAEVIRMLHTILGEELFQEGVALYLRRFDGQAVTCDDFVQALEDVFVSHETNQALLHPLALFRRWYSQAGTPALQIESKYDEQSKRYSLTVLQNPAKVKDQQEKEMHIPLAIGLLDKNGHEIPVQLENTSEPHSNSMVLNICDKEQTFTFTGVNSEPTPSLLRGFSAPVKLEYDYSDDDLYFLLINDQDPFNRWEAGQRLLINNQLKLINDFLEGQTMRCNPQLLELFPQVLSKDFHRDKSFISQILTLPSEEYLAEQLVTIPVEAIHESRLFLRREIGRSLAGIFQQTYHDNTDPQPYRYHPQLAGQRRLKNLSLNYLMATGEQKFIDLCGQQLSEADNMTDEISALQNLVHSGCPESESALQAFFDKWKHESLVVDKWLAIQATAPLKTTIKRVEDLSNNPCFTIKNPNKVRALIGTFAGANPICFHDKDGGGYEFLADKVLELNPINPNIAARLVGRLSRWKRYDQHRQELMRSQLERITTTKDLAKGVYEVASKSLSC